MKIGLDIHGVTDTHNVFKSLAAIMISSGHEVHIITGTSVKNAMKDLQALGMCPLTHYTHLFSITDTLIQNQVDVKWLDVDNPIFPDDEWNKAKAIYCQENGIDIHFDDSSIYGTYFTTTYAMITQSDHTA